MIDRKLIYCCGCQSDVDARLSDGQEAYPHRPDLYSLPFWFCDQCGNFVGCHHKTSSPTRPLGNIPTPELKRARQKIHKVIDPIWQSGAMKRNEVYANLSDAMGFKYHTAKLRNMQEAKKALDAATQISGAHGMEVAHD